MIQQLDHVRVITNDDEGNAPGDFACVRIKAGITDGFTTVVRDEGWVLIGSSYVEKCRGVPSFVDLVYRFRGAQ